MKEKFVGLAEKFIEHCKNGDIYDEPFEFKIDDGYVSHIFGTVLIQHFDTLLFVTSVYGDTSGSSASMFAPMDFADNFDDFDELDWKYFLEEATEYFYKEYGNWGKPIV